ncbi:ABC transporter ATP-binding protein [Aliikangiella coralliicola]|uniref:ABC transporter ATP-binding protein n=1 Tax=Aliikangiella coralliicola TaxID=2592383 RepID=A0A545U7A4_9GAMM|nr:ABC transporter ATP-binding protein [Aliikangiella coralliicola]TQV85349.1 ABC transporter ATP-binding protein [Aliikangiella coralliicola]
MSTLSLTPLWYGFKQFFMFSPRKQSVILVLMLLQGLTASIGLLFIIPLLQIIGFEVGITNINGIAASAGTLFEYLNLELNLPNILLCYVLIVTTIASLRYQLTIQTSSIQQAYINFLRNRLYRCLLQSNWQFIIQNRMSDFAHSLSGQIQSIGHASNLILNILSQLILATLTLSLAFLLSWQLSLMAIGFALLLSILLFPVNRIIYGSGQKQLLNFKMIFQILTEQLISLKIIKSFAGENYHANKMQQISTELESQQLKLVRMNAITLWLYMVITVISFSLFFYISQTVLLTPLATSLLLLVIFSRLLPQFSMLQKNYQQLVHKVPAFNDIHQMMEKCINHAEVDASEIPSPKLNNKIQLKNISFQYADKKSPVFSNINLTIHKNQTVALVGPSGSGKSTLADLIAGLLTPTHGQIFCDDILLDETFRLAWRKQIAYVTQETYLFHDTVRKNLSWVTNSRATDQQLWEVLSQASADTFVRELPQGLDTIIGDHGMRLSGGERQRLALARSLLTNPQLLILDEATSALDRDNEQKIQQALKQLRGNLTLLIIAHSETTIQHVDKRIELTTRLPEDDFKKVIE